MSVQEWVGLALALFMGLTLGLVGAGGSILTVPLLVYFFGLTPTRATGTSLAIVGGVALVGAIMAWRRGEVSGKAALMFGVPSVATAFLVRRFLMPAVPNIVFGISKETLILLLFAVVMFTAAYSMLKKREPKENQSPKGSIWLMSGVAVGTLTGVLGAGGGGIIVPALNAGMGLPMRLAIGSALCIIALNATAGLVADLSVGPPIDWSLVGLIGTLALVGLAIGATVQKRVPVQHLKIGFGWMIVAIAVSIVGREVWTHLT